MSLNLIFLSFFVKIDRNFMFTFGNVKWKLTIDKKNLFNVTHTVRPCQARLKDAYRAGCFVIFYPMSALIGMICGEV
ncbi:Uncharacterized protein TCM_033100 [Theobroma cacao]|uniref:Uncharacterized protein n=1 Tax=Theobroma cacao TaxID=3641 RepID=A0A061FAU6_THECC|nr:Uncharacterized protein TCM_033100 [Theobroma cacao]